MSITSLLTNHRSVGVVTDGYFGPIRNVVPRPSLSHYSHQTAVDWLTFIRDVCSADLLTQPIQVGGPGHIVAIDECLIARRKPGNVQGRAQSPNSGFFWVDLTTKQFFMQLQVPARDAATLLPIIQRYILPQTKIWSDEWAAYNAIAGLVQNYVHETVNHS